MRVNDMAGNEPGRWCYVGPGRYGSPHHRMPWRAICVGAYGKQCALDDMASNMRLTHGEHLSWARYYNELVVVSDLCVLTLHFSCYKLGHVLILDKLASQSSQAVPLSVARWSLPLPPSAPPSPRTRTPPSRAFPSFTIQLN
jgi:hypothetical protein